MIENEAEKKKNPTNPEQASEHTTLFTSIKKTLRERKYLYTFFTNFRKAYDSICR